MAISSCWTTESRRRASSSDTTHSPRCQSCLHHLQEPIEKVGRNGSESLGVSRERLSESPLGVDDGCEASVGEHRQEHEPVEPAPRESAQVLQPERLFHVAVRLFDAPTVHVLSTTAFASSVEATSSVVSKTRGSGANV
ncbi:hypothetical protein LCGC14_0832600 [marine sediment metagenome]|uniref:Uncharacterized protein n=1 Tax=marine sediment metagenome TaxID=412755 RepID=A0A0F9S0A8_9ZZZZ